MSEFVPPPGWVGSEQLRYMREAIAACAALDAAERLGVLDRLAEGLVDPSSLSRECAASERGIRLLLGALAGIGIVEATDDGRYRAAMVDIDRLPVLRAVWNHLDQIIREGRPAVAGDTPAGAQKLYPDVVPRLGARFAAAAREMADRLAGASPRVLDVGAGAAPWSIAIASRDPGCRVTALDLPAVLPSTRAAVRATGLDSQFTFLEGDLFATEMGWQAYDLVIVGNLCHLFDEATNERMLKRVFQTISPGGTLAILDALPNEQLDGPRPVMLYALGLLLRTIGGKVYPFSTYAGWLRAAGYERMERLDLDVGNTQSLITARRPA